jgi:hypothetical protein
MMSNSKSNTSLVGVFNLNTNIPDHINAHNQHMTINLYTHIQIMTYLDPLHQIRHMLIIPPSPQNTNT